MLAGRVGMTAGVLVILRKQQRGSSARTLRASLLEELSAEATLPILLVLGQYAIRLESR